METRHPVVGLFGSEFPATYNCPVMSDGLKSQDVKNFPKFLRFLEKRLLTVKLSKFCSESFHRDTDRRVVFKFQIFGRRKIGEIVRCLPDKKFAWLSSCLYWADRAQYLPGPAPDSVLRMLQI